MKQPYFTRQATTKGKLFGSNMLRRCFYIVFMTIAFCTSIFTQDTIIFINNDTLLAYVEEVNNQEVQYSKEKRRDAASYLMNQSKVRAIYLEGGKEYYVREHQVLIKKNMQYSNEEIAEPDTNIYIGHNIFINLLGNGSWISANYERILLKNKNLFITGSLGAGLTSDIQLELDIGFSNPQSSNTPGEPSQPSRSFTLNSQVMANYGKGQHLLLAGLGVSAMVSKDYGPIYHVYPLIGWGKHFRGRKCNIRLYASAPLFTELGTPEYTWIPIGFSAGFML